MGKGNRKDEEKKEEKKEKKISSASLGLSLPKIAGNKDKAGESASADLNPVNLDRLQLESKTM